MFQLKPSELSLYVRLKNILLYQSMCFLIAITCESLDSFISRESLLREYEYGIHVKTKNFIFQGSLCLSPDANNIIKKK